MTALRFDSDKACLCISIDGLLSLCPHALPAMSVISRQHPASLGQFIKFLINFFMSRCQSTVAMV